MPSRSQYYNLTTQAYKIILKKIVNTDYQPGQKISEKQFEEDVQIGRTPVREALLQLRQEHLIDVIPQSGTYISKIDLNAVMEARFIRASTEQRVMREAAALELSADQLKMMDEILNNQESDRKADDFRAFMASDDSFHEYFYRATNHEQVWQWLQKINIQFNRFRFLRLKVQKLSWEGLVEEHKEIFNAVKSHDINEADRLTSNHMHRMLDEKDSLIKAFPNFFINVN